MSKARAELNWKKQFELCIDKEKAIEYRKRRKPQDKDVCTMCGRYCAVKLIKRFKNEADS